MSTTCISISAERHDWLPTLATLAGAETLVPTDRPIDGVDSSDMLLGRSEKSSRDHLISYGPDGEVWAVKWKTMKVIFKYSANATVPALKPTMPMVFDLINDPGETDDLMSSKMTCGWVLYRVYGRILAFDKSAEKFPHIKPGAEFEGYK